MKKFVINLARRTDRRESFLIRNSFLTDVNFVEAADGNTLTNDDLTTAEIYIDQSYKNRYTDKKITKGEIGCFISHYGVWKMCVEMNETIMVFEDDAIVDRNLFDELYYFQIMKQFNFLYLGRIENSPESVTTINSILEKPSYPYNSHAYVLTPEAAKILIDTDILTRIIPTDEYIPQMLVKLNAVALRIQVVGQLLRTESPSDIETTNNDNNFNIHVVTVGTDREKCNRLYESASKFGINIINIGQNIKWTGGDTTGPSGGIKINLLKNYIEPLSNYDVILFTDAYDVFFNSDINTIVNRAKTLEAQIVFAGEKYCWPNKFLSKKFPDTASPYRFLNSGLFIGQVGAIKSAFSSIIMNDEDDQLYCQMKFLAHNHSIKIDHNCLLFQCYEPEVYIKDKSLYNPITNSFPCIYHGNGGNDAKEHVDVLYKKIIKKETYENL